MKTFSAGNGKYVNLNFLISMLVRGMRKCGKNNSKWKTGKKGL